MIFMMSVLVLLSICKLSMQAATILTQIPTVKISQGIFKYILIEATLKGHNEKRHFVRGDVDCQYHSENYDLFKKELKDVGYQVKKASHESIKATKGEEVIAAKCLGGGRIEHNYKGKKCFIYGYSQSFGKVDHTIAQKLISQALEYPIKEITTSPDGY